jgi:hypothetical protein
MQDWGVDVGTSPCGWSANRQDNHFYTTDDGLSIAGMFFTKMDTLHAKHMSGEMGKVRL